MDISKKLKNRRKELGLTMLQLANKTGVSEATISRWESGDIANMRRDKIVSLAKALQVSSDYVMGWEENTEEKSETITKAENELLNNYRKLNDVGKSKADEYISDLSFNPKYRKRTQQTSYTSVTREIAAYGGKGTKGTFTIKPEEIT